MDEKTFQAVRDRLEELGAVGPTGLDYRRLAHTQPWWQKLM